MLRKLISEVRLIPVGLERPDAYLEAEVIGNVNGLLSLQPALADTIGGGGRICTSALRVMLHENGEGGCQEHEAQAIVRRLDSAQGS